MNDEQQQQQDGAGRVVWRQRGVFSNDRRYANPLRQQPQQPRRRHLPVGVSFLVLGASLGAIAVFLLSSPLLSLDYRIVEGNSLISTQQVLDATETYTNQRLFGIIPRRNYFAFPTAQAAEYLTTTLGATQALEQVRVEKRFPARITISLEERTPNVVYVNGGTRYLLDRSGYLTSRADEDTALPVDTFPVLYDQTTRTVAVGEQGTSADIVSALFSIQDLLLEETDIPIDFFYTPSAKCPQDIFPAPEPTEEPVGEGTNANTNTSTTNTAVADETNANSTSNTNQEEEQVRDASDLQELIAGEPCNLASRALATQELRVRSTEDWEIYFRISDNLQDQVTRLLRVLREQHLDRAKLDYVDLRFGEQVIYK